MSQLWLCMPAIENSVFDFVTIDLHTVRECECLGPACSLIFKRQRNTSSLLPGCWKRCQSRAGASRFSALDKILVPQNCGFSHQLTTIESCHIYGSPYLYSSLCYCNTHAKKMPVWCEEWGVANWLKIRLNHFVWWESNNGFIHTVIQG